MANFIEMGVDLSEKMRPSSRSSGEPCGTLVYPVDQYISSVSLSFRGCSKAKILAEMKLCIGKKLYKIITS